MRELAQGKEGFESRIIPNRCRPCEQKGQLVWPEWTTGRPGQFPWKLIGQSNYFICWPEAIYLVVKHFIAVLWCLIAIFEVEQMIYHVSIFIKLLLLSLQSTVLQFIKYVMMLSARTLTTQTYLQPLVQYLLLERAWRVIYSLKDLVNSPMKWEY